MKNLIKTITILIITSFMFYLVGSFVAWEINPANWDPVLRWFIAMCSLIFGGMIGMANYR